MVLLLEVFGGAGATWPRNHGQAFQLPVLTGFHCFPRRRTGGRAGMGTGLCSLPGLFLRALSMKTGSPKPLCLPQGSARIIGPGHGKRTRHWCLSLFVFQDMRKTSLVPRTTAGSRGFVAQSGMGLFLSSLVAGHCEGFGYSESCTLRGRTRKARHQALQGVLSKIYG